MAVLRMKNEMRYGTVQVAAKGRVSGFTEKTDGDSGGFVNAGIYVSIAEFSITFRKDQLASKGISFRTCSIMESMRQSSMDFSSI